MHRTYQYFDLQATTYAADPLNLDAAGRVAGWLAGWLVGLAGWLAGLAGWLGWLSGWIFMDFRGFARIWCHNALQPKGT